jgi:hypothetical protein
MPRREWLLVLLTLPACGDSSAIPVHEEDLYVAALEHVDTTLHLKTVPIVHPAMMSVDATAGEPLGWDRGKLYMEHPTDAIRTAVSRNDAFMVCDPTVDLTCMVQPGEIFVTFSEIDWSEWERPRLHVTVVERFPMTFGARTFRAVLWQRENKWTVRQFDLTSVEN